MAAKPKNPSPFFPEFDLEEFMSKFQIPGADTEAVKGLMETHQKNLEAIVAANQAAAQGYQTLAQRQMEIFQDSLSKLSEVSSVPDNPVESATDALQTSMDQMRELMELAAKANQDAFEIISSRAQQTLDDLGK